jgi:hypothetical protein
MLRALLLLFIGVLQFVGSKNLSAASNRRKLSLMKRSKDVAAHQDWSALQP